MPLTLSRALLKFEEDEAARSGQPDIARELGAIACSSAAVRRPKDRRCCRSTWPWSSSSGRSGCWKPTRCCWTGSPAGRTRRRAQAGHAVSHAVEGGQAALRAGAARAMGDRAPARRTGQSAASWRPTSSRASPSTPMCIALRDLLAKMTVAGAPINWGDATGCFPPTKRPCRSRSTRRTGRADAADAGLRRGR